MARDLEGPIHRAILHHLRAQFPGAVIHHSPNELPLVGSMVSRAIAKAKHNGMVPGFPDLVCFFEGGRAAFFEVKADKNTTSDAQRAVIEALRGLGFPVAVVRSVDDVNAALAAWSIHPGSYRDLRNKIVGGEE